MRACFPPLSPKMLTHLLACVVLSCHSKDLVYPWSCLLDMSKVHSLIGRTIASLQRACMGLQTSLINCHCLCQTFFQCSLHVILGVFLKFSFFHCILFSHVRFVGPALCMTILELTCVHSLMQRALHHAGLCTRGCMIAVPVFAKPQPTLVVECNFHARNTSRIL